MSGSKYLGISYDPVIFPDNSTFSREIATVTFNREYYFFSISTLFIYFN